MTKDFATTVAAVAPVILLVATVEIGRTRDAIRRVSERDAQMSHIVAALFTGATQPTREEFDEARQRLRELRTGRGKRLLVVLYTFSAALMSAALVMAEVVSLQWLAEGGGYPAEATATFCYYAVGGSFVWVWAVAVALYLRAAHTARPRLQPWWFIRFWWLHWSYRRSEPQGAFGGPDS